MDFKQLLENKVLLASIIGGVILLLVVFIICGTISATSKSNGEQVDVSNIPLKNPVDLLTTDNLGKALEIQALLAKHGIVATRLVDGTKSLLRLEPKSCTTTPGKCTTEKRDLAIMLIVESGLYDQNVDIHDVMTAMSKAELAVNITTTVTGKVIQAYDKIMQLQI